MMDNKTNEKTDALQITRPFSAPRGLVWKAWTEPERLMKWWGPKGVVMVTADMDLRPGGRFHYAYRMPDGSETWGLFVYHEVEAPHRLTFVNSFSDEKGNIIRHPLSATWPMEVINHLELIDQGKQTLLVLSGGPWHASSEEEQVFISALAGIQGGMKGTFSQLDEYLARVQS